MNFALGGTAQVGADYTPSLAGGVARFRPGQREVFIEIAPLDDAEAEADNRSRLKRCPVPATRWGRRPLRSRSKTAFPACRRRKRRLAS
ncbi:MAG: hypothetical protein R3F11_25355 [Verrucomicrobiales bacterium]